MRLVSFALAGPLGPLRRLGVLSGTDAVIDITAATRDRLLAEGVAAQAADRIAEAITPPRMVDFIAAGRLALDAATLTLEWATDTTPRYPLAGVERLPAVPDAPLLRDFLAFEGHLRNIYPRLGREIPPEWYEFPAYYKGNTASLGADGDVVAVPPYAEEVDFEFEFAAVIGRGGSDIPAEKAREHIYGYTVYNDFSARKMQSREMAIGLGPAKGKDFRRAHVLGPWLVTADEVPDPYSLRMRSWVNGELWTDTSSADMHWRFEDMIAHASAGELLRPGEVFGSGTVANGCGAERGVSLQRGDTVTLTVDGLGTLRNQVA